MIGIRIKFYVVTSKFKMAGRLYKKLFKFQMFAA